MTQSDMVKRLTARMFGQLVLVFAVVITIGCDRVTKHVATTTLAGTPDRSYLGDTVRVVYAENTGGFLSIGADLPAPARTALFTFATGLALSFGAPFWFDALSKFMNLRAAGAKPERQT